MIEQSLLLEGLRVLVVDDNADTCLLMTLLLSMHGVKVSTVCSAKEAIDWVRRLPVDALIADLAMPGEDGISLIRQVRTLKPEQGGQVPAIALTALSTKEVRELALKAGFQTFLTKPVDLNELINALTNLFCCHI